VIKFNNFSILFVLISLFFLKVVAYLTFKGLDLNFLGGGNDSVYYHSYAVGELDHAVNLWPVILRFLNDLGVYDRDGVSFFMFFLDLMFVPFLVYLCSVFSMTGRRQRVFLISYLVVAAYPSLFFFSLDIYRDLVMLAVFLLAVFAFRLRLERGGIVYIVLFFLLCYVSFLFREYLGGAMFISYVLLFLYSKTSKYFWGWVVFYVVGLMVAQALGAFDAITTYRGEDGFAGGGATLGVGLSGRDPFTFLTLFLYSFLAQVLGLYFPNPSSVLVFLVESVPFFFAFLYVLKNRAHMNFLCKYLLIFFVVYTTIWVIGNDNLGTAVRLRVPGYLSIFICFLIISQRKRILS